MGSNDDRPTITPEMKISDLLEHYPQLESVLKETIPSFAKLKNPALMAVVTETKTVRQVADAEGVTIGDIIARLRGRDGCPESTADAQSAQQSGECPSWLDNGTEVGSLDAREQIHSGGHPLPTVMALWAD